MSSKCICLDTSDNTDKHKDIIRELNTAYKNITYKYNEQGNYLALQDKRQYFDTLIKRVSELYYLDHEYQTLWKIHLQQIVITTISTPYLTMHAYYYNTMKKIWSFFSICKPPKLLFLCVGSTHYCGYDHSRNSRNHLCGYITVLNPSSPNHDHREHTATIRVHHMFNLRLNYTTIALPTADKMTCVLYAHLLVFHLNLMPWEIIDKDNIGEVYDQSPNSEHYLIYGSMKPFYEVVAFNTVHYVFWRVIKSMRMRLVVVYTVVNLEVSMWMRLVVVYTEVNLEVSIIYLTKKNLI